MNVNEQPLDGVDPEQEPAEFILDAMDDGLSAREERDRMAKAARDAKLLARLQQIAARNPLDREIEAKKLAVELNVRMDVIREMITLIHQGRNPLEDSKGSSENTAPPITWDPSTTRSIAFRIINHSRVPWI